MAKFTRKRKFNKKIYTFDEAEKIVINIKQLDGLSEETLKAYYRIFIDFKKYWGSEIDLSTLTISDARNYVKWNLYEKTPYKNSSRQDLSHKKGVSIKTTNSYIIMAKSVFNLLEKEGISDNIFKDIKKVKEHEKPIETLSVTEINTLFKAFDKRNYVDFRDYVICHFMLDAFSRIGETVNVQKSDINFESRSVIFKQTKGKKIRTVPLSIETIRLLEELIQENEDSDSEFVFLNIFGNKVNDDTVRKNIYKVAKRSGVITNIHPHIFRHTASRMYIEQGGNLRVLQLILGHASSETTERYAHVLDSTIEEYHKEFSPIKQLKKKAKTKTSRNNK